MRLLVIFAALAFVAKPAHSADLAPSFVPGHVVVKWQSAEVALHHAQLQLFHLPSTVNAPQLIRSLAADTHLVATTPTRAATEALLAQLRSDPDVAWAEPDYIRSAPATR